MKIVILGYGPAAVSALRAMEKLRRQGRGEETEITVVAPETHPPYSPMFLIEYVFGNIAKRQFCLALPSQDGLRFTAITGRKAATVLTKENLVLLDDGQRLGYDRLLIATGASALKPPVQGLEKPGVFFINRLDDALRLRERVKRASNVVIVGAGAIGIETALALAGQGKRVTVVEALGQILPLMLDEDLAGYLQRKLEQRGIVFLLNSKVCEVTGKRRAEGVICEKEVAGDLVVVAVGFRPNLDFINPEEIKTARGLLVSERMQTSAGNIYAAGDVTEARNPFADRHELNFTWYSAVEQGQVAGCNMLGADKKLLYSPNLNVLKGLDFTVASIGQKVNSGRMGFQPVPDVRPLAAIAEKTSHTGGPMRRGAGRMGFQPVPPGPEAGSGYEVLSSADEKAGIFEKIYIKGKYIEHYQSIGLPYKLGYIYNLVQNRKNISRIKPYLTTSTPEACSPVFLT